MECDKILNSSSLISILFKFFFKYKQNEYKYEKKVNKKHHKYLNDTLAKLVAEEEI